MSGWSSMLPETLRISVPYACAAVAGVWAERSGVIHIGLEAVLLTSAFAAAVAAEATGSPLLGLLCGVVAGVVVSVAHALLVERAKIDAVVSGVALNMLAYAATRLALRGLYDSSSNSPSIPTFEPGSTGGSLGAMLGRVLLDPVTLVAVVVLAASPIALARTRLGLRLRACGESPEAAHSLGIRVTATRVAALAISGAICALGGVHLAFDQGRFESGMSAGRGFIALAAVVLSGWRAGRAALACLAFGLLEALQIGLQDASGGSKVAALVQLLPYVATLVVLALGMGRASAPRGLGKRVS